MTSTGPKAAQHTEVEKTGKLHSKFSTMKNWGLAGRSLHQETTSGVREREKSLGSTYNGAVALTLNMEKPLLLLSKNLSKLHKTHSPGIVAGRRPPDPSVS